MKVLIIAGSGDYADNRRLLPDDFEVDILMDVARIDLSLSPIRRVAFHQLTVLRFLRRLHKYDAVLSTATTNGISLALIQTLLKQKRPAHFMIDVALPRFFPPRRRVALGLPKFVFSSVRRVVCFATMQADYWNHNLGIDGKARFVPLGFDEFGAVKKDTRYIGCVASAGRSGRDYRTLLEAFSGIDEQLVILTGKDALGGATLKLDSSRSNIRLLFEVPYENYLQILAASKFVIIPLHDLQYVTGQSVVLHAMSLGKAVIATSGLSTLDYVVDGKSGLLVPPYDAKSLRNAITWLLANPREVERMGQYGRALVTEKYNRKVMSREIGRVVETSVGRLPK